MIDLTQPLGSREAVVSGASRGAVLRAAGIPSDPFEGLYTAHIPEPPRLTEEQAPELRALIVVRAYLGALKADDLKPTQWQSYARRDRTPDITKTKVYGVLCRLADLFVEHEIPPAAWAAFRLDTLRHPYTTGQKPGEFKTPTLPHLMSAKWLGEGPRRGWFRRDYASRGWRGKVVSTTSRDTLMEIWGGLQRDLDGVAELDVETAKALFALRFPGNLLQTLIERASAEGRALQAHYNGLAAQGEWLW